MPVKQVEHQNALLYSHAFRAAVKCYSTTYMICFSFTYNKEKQSKTLHKKDSPAKFWAEFRKSSEFALAHNDQQRDIKCMTKFLTHNTFKIFYCNSHILWLNSLQSQFLISSNKQFCSKYKMYNKKKFLIKNPLNVRLLHLFNLWGFN